MNLEFTANWVSYEEALGGDIVQFTFDEDPDDDPLNPQSKSVHASICYEIPPCELLFEWMDGREYDGGLKATRYSLSDKQFVVTLENGASIQVEHSAGVETLRNIRTLLLREVGPEHVV